MHEPAGSNVLTLNAEAATDLSGNGNLGHIAVLDANGDAVLAGASGTGTNYAGCILHGGRNAGDPILVVALGSALGVAGAAINEGEYLGTAADAELVVIAAANEMACAEAFQDAADQDLFWILMIRFQSTDGKP